MREFAYDIKMSAVVRVKAESDEEARAILPRVLDCMDLSEIVVEGFNSGIGTPRVKLTEASLNQDDGEPYLFEIDGEEV